MCGTNMKYLWPRIGWSGHSDLEQQAASPILFRKRELFNILVSERRRRHRELRNKVKCMREFDTGDLVVVRKQLKSSRNTV